MDMDLRNYFQVVQHGKPTGVIDSDAPVVFIMGVASNGCERSLYASLKNVETGQRVPLFETSVPASADIFATQQVIRSMYLGGVSDGRYTLNVIEDRLLWGHMPILVRSQRRPDCGN
jgi:hypothetical protein